MTEKLDVRDIQNNEKFAATILMPAQGGGYNEIKCYMPNDFSFSLSNNWGELANFQDTGSKVGDLMNLMAAGGSSDIGFGSAGFAQGTLQSLYMTSASWKGSAMPTFSIPTVFVAYDEDHNPLDDLMKLAAGTLPSNTYNIRTAATGLAGSILNVLGGAAETAVSFGLGSLIGPELVAGQMMQGKTFTEAMTDTKGLFDGIGKSMVEQGGQRAPLGFGLQGTDSSGGFFKPLPGTTIGLKIGRWFMAMAPELIMSDLSGISISKEVTKFNRQTQKGGFPLYVMCTINLRPYRMITFKEFLGYFRDVTNRDASFYTSEGGR